MKAWGVLGTGIGAELLQPGEPCSASARGPRKPGPAFWVTGPAKAGVPHPRHCRRGREEEDKTKWKPPSLGGASCAVLWVSVCITEEGASEMGGTEKETNQTITNYSFTY